MKAALSLFTVVVSLAACAPAPGAQQAAPPAGAPALPPMAVSRTGATPGVATPEVATTEAPAGGRSIADTWAQRASLANTSVTVRGTVVKVNNGIMGSNWFHLQDGTGKASDGTNDLTVTTDAVVTVGDVVTVTGILATKKDFGAGYSYEAIIEKATVHASSGK
jgi:hypothetical protein